MRFTNVKTTSVIFRFLCEIVLIAICKAADAERNCFLHKTYFNRYETSFLKDELLGDCACKNVTTDISPTTQLLNESNSGQNITKLCYIVLCSTSMRKKIRLQHLQNNEKLLKVNKLLQCKNLEFIRNILLFKLFDTLYYNKSSFGVNENDGLCFTNCIVHLPTMLISNISYCFPKIDSRIKGKKILSRSFRLAKALLTIPCVHIVENNNSKPNFVFLKSLFPKYKSSIFRALMNLSLCIKSLNSEFTYANRKINYYQRTCHILKNKFTLYLSICATNAYHDNMFHVTNFKKNGEPSIFQIYVVRNPRCRLGNHIVYIAIHSRAIARKFIIPKKFTQTADATKNNNLYQDDSLNENNISNKEYNDKLIFVTKDTFRNFSWFNNTEEFFITTRKRHKRFLFNILTEVHNERDLQCLGLFLAGHKYFGFDPRKGNAISWKYREKVR